MELHANSKATAADIGLPVYPVSTLHKDKGTTMVLSTWASVSATRNSGLLAADYVASDSPDKILAFYRKPHLALRRGAGM